MMSACWVAFARTGKPSCAPAPEWPAYTPATDLRMEFGTDIKVAKPERAAAYDLLTSNFH
jgi:para-nitrobenzyl esterase